MEIDAQDEEAETLKAIYDADFGIVSGNPRTYCIAIQASNAGIEGTISDVLHMELQVICPADYPSSSPPVYELRAPWMKPADVEHIAENLSKIYSEHQGEVVVYQWVEWIREYVSSKLPELMSQVPDHLKENEPAEIAHSDQDSSVIKDRTSDEVETITSHGAELSLDLPPPDNEQRYLHCPTILHGEPLTDRKSTFQAHAAAVTTVQEPHSQVHALFSCMKVKAVLSELKTTRKIATASHNILAYRLYDATRKTFIQDCDDDGEHAAGGRLLHLLQIMDVHNVMVVVTRWYGGILLHSDRFKHINNVARILLQETGIGLEHKENTVGHNTKKKKTAKPGKHK